MKRIWAKFYAFVFGYFWLPCPVCGEPFGGHETGLYSLMDSLYAGRSVCRKVSCQETARLSGERVQREAPPKLMYFPASTTAPLGGQQCK